MRTGARDTAAIDRRLLTYARATRAFLVALTVLDVVTAALVIAQAWLLADLISSAFAGGRRVGELRTPLVMLLGVVFARATIAWARELLAVRASARAKTRLRSALLAHVGALGPQYLSERRTGELTVLATRGIDALDAYFSLYVPQVLLALIVPVSVLVVVADRDWISALIIAATLPLIPLFMALIGAATRDKMDLQFRTLQTLAGHFLDVVAGLPTLKVFGRAKAQIAAIGEVTDRYRRTAMSTLRVTFLSSGILELVATISVALVAVTIGVRLMDGHVGLRTALVVLLLAPEAYLPLRMLGANYHASTEGMSAARQVFDVLELPVPQRGERHEVLDLTVAEIVVEDLAVSYPDRDQPALNAVSLTIEPGEVVAITGPSGCGKSTLMAVMLGFLDPSQGSIWIGGVELSTLHPDAWREQVSWMPQRPHLFAGSIADNIRLGRRDATVAEVADAAAQAGLADVLAARPQGLQTQLGDRGAGLSVGERQRVALARAFLRDAPLLLLDEPTANLDGGTEEQVLVALQRLVNGRTTLIVAHRPALVGLADRVVELDRQAVVVA